MTKKLQSARSWQNHSLVILIAASIVGSACGDGRDREQPASSGDSETPNSLTSGERTAGWRLLFDGQSLTGWRGLGLDTVPAGHWVIEEGMIRKVASGTVPTQADGQPLEGRDLMTVETFGDFEISFEWKVSRGGNSGIKYNVSEQLSMANPPKHAALGFEYQILDDQNHPDGELASHRTGALYDLVAPGSNKRLRPVGEFNSSRIVFRGSHGEHWLNDEKVVVYDLGPRFDSLLAASKYAAFTGFAERRRGHIVLQDHSGDAWFRNIKIRTF